MPIAIKTTPEWQQLYIAALGFKDLGMFAQSLFPNHCRVAFSTMHQHFFTLMANPLERGQRLVIAAPRGYAKTTLFVLVKIIHAIVYQTEPYIIVVCQTNEEAKERVRQISDELRSNPWIQAVFGEILPTKSRGGLSQKLTTLSGIRVEAISVDMQFRGKKHQQHRPTLIVLDDVEKLANTYNVQQREKLHQWFTKDVMKAGETDGSTNMVFIGTVLHMDSLLAKLLVNPEWDHHRYQAVLSFSSHHDHWQQWRNLITDLRNPNHLADADAYFEAHEAEMLEGTGVLWPEQESYLDLMKMRVFGGEGAFRSEKQNDPYDPEHQLFDMSLAKTFRVVDEHIVLTNPDETISLRELTIVAYHDPCLANEPHNLVGDYGAIAVVGRTRNGLLFLLDCFLKKAPPDEQIAAAYRLRSQWGFREICVESNGFQQLLKPLYLQYAKDRGEAHLPVIEIKQHTSKRERIASLQPDIVNGQLLFNESLPKALMDQFKLFPTDHDDGPDAVQGAVARFTQHNPMSFQTVHSPRSAQRVRFPRR